MVVHQTTQETMPVKVLANSPYSTDLEYWENKETAGGYAFFGTTFLYGSGDAGRL